jgi:hypothetical protein
MRRPSGESTARLALGSGSRRSTPAAPAAARAAPAAPARAPAPAGSVTAHSCVNRVV